ncbi:MAG: NUDIX hydrolase [Pirellulaceae bacterium]
MSDLWSDGKERSGSHVRDNGRHGVVGVVHEEGRFLVIRRSRWVRAPRMICFPGGSIEPNEDFPTAIRREMDEELSLQVEVIKHLWSSRTAWGTNLEWMLCRRPEGQPPVPDPREVEEVFWMSREEILSHREVLGSMPGFFERIDTDPHWDRL